MPSLLDLPTELLMEIVKSYPPLYAYDADALAHGVKIKQFYGHNALRALSQTCCTLRTIFLPALWVRVHAGPLWVLSREGSHKILERRMRGIQRTPYVVPYIRSLSVSLKECNMDNWQPIAQFIRVLRLLPNLRTLTILGLRHDMVSILAASCEGSLFPSVVTLALPDDLSSILHCFPNVQALTHVQHGSSYYGGLELIGAASHCNQLHTFNNPLIFGIAGLHKFDFLRKSIPHIQRLSIWQNLDGIPADPILQGLRSLEGMDNLSELSLRYSVGDASVENPNVGSHLGKILEAGKDVLRTSKATGRKVLQIQHLTVYSNVIEKETRYILEGREWVTVTSG
ncbi:hypothetical protein B0H13DRAFT_586761 [Mycena leptocephala]|nr:hypothetical protein B0H13DRAFT_586761 [Mycena leptocephala]